MLGVATILVGLSALLVRFGRSWGVERQQLKWFLVGGAVSVLGAFTPSAWFNAVTGPSVAVGAGIAARQVPAARRPDRAQHPELVHVAPARP